jgi:hypothetical protein
MGNLDAAGSVEPSDLDIISTDKEKLVAAGGVSEPSAEVFAFFERFLGGLVKRLF